MKIFFENASLDIHPREQSDKNCSCDVVTSCSTFDKKSSKTLLNVSLLTEVFAFSSRVLNLRVRGKQKMSDFFSRLVYGRNCVAKFSFDKLCLFTGHYIPVFFVR